MVRLQIGAQMPACLRNDQHASFHQPLVLPVGFKFLQAQCADY
jgi:hypothetical protein